jgi:hypothetical protein
MHTSAERRNKDFMHMQFSFFSSSLIEKEKFAEKRKIIKVLEKIYEQRI